jgi:hypothetical protein
VRGIPHIGRRTGAAALVVIAATCLCTFAWSAARPPASRAASVTVTPSPSAAPSAGVSATASASTLRERLYLLTGFLERWANEHYNFYPPASSVHSGGIPAPMWPSNPWTGAAMHPGSGAGDYTYATQNDRLAYTLTGHYPGGSVVISVHVPATRMMQNDHRTIEAGELIQQFIERYILTHGGKLPAVDEVKRGGAVGRGSGATWWPHQPWTHRYMVSGHGWSDFTYTLDASATHYTLTVYFSRGGSRSVHGPLPIVATDQSAPGHWTRPPAGPASFGLGGDLAPSVAGLEVADDLGLFSVAVAAFH